MQTNSINCPKCGNEIDVNEILYTQLHSQLSKEFASKLNKEKNELEERNLALETEKAKLQKQKSEIDESIAAGINKKLSAERAKYEKQIREQITEEKSDELKSYRQQLDEKTKEIRAMNKLKAENEKLQREKSEMKEKLEAEAEVKITNAVEHQRKKIRKEVEDMNELKIAEKEHIIKQLKNQLVTAQQKAEQGSGQLRGEVLETGMEDHLRKSFPFDLVEEIKKGVKGADCLHTVRTALQQICGTVYYEVKRAKEFQASWIPKFKDDMRARNATVGVLVTEAYPAGMERLSMKEGIWICSYQEAKGLCHVLRETLILLNDAKAAQIDKGGKMEILYAYMVSNEFRMQIEAIVEGFTEMQDNLMRERRSMESIWKQRQKQIEKVLLNTTHIYSSIRGIAGNAIGPIRQLELDSEVQNGIQHRKSLTSKTSNNGSANAKLPR
jgi:hypothetical protein